jgi:glutaredoxin-like protein NrdH
MSRLQIIELDRDCCNRAYQQGIADGRFMEQQRVIELVNHPAPAAAPAPTQKAKPMPKIPVTVYHIGPSCVQCNQTKRMMDNLGIEYVQVDLREHPDILEGFKAEGLSSAPIVTTDIKKWSGFRYEKIKSLATYIASQSREALA